MIKKWENARVSDRLKVAAGDLSSISIDSAGELAFTAITSGYDDPGVIGGSNDYCRPPEFDIEIHKIESAIFTDEECNEAILSAEQIEIILDGDEIYEMICDVLINGR